MNESKSYSHSFEKYYNESSKDLQKDFAASELLTRGVISESQCKDLYRLKVNSSDE